MESIEDMRASTIRLRFDPVKANALNQKKELSTNERLKFSQSLVNYQMFLQSDFWSTAADMES
jgi:hypothetical protein